MPKNVKISKLLPKWLLPKTYWFFQCDISGKKLLIRLRGVLLTEKKILILQISGLGLGALSVWTYFGQHRAFLMVIPNHSYQVNSGCQIVPRFLKTSRSIHFHIRCLGEKVGAGKLLYIIASATCVIWAFKIVIWEWFVEFQIIILLSIFNYSICTYIRIRSI